MSTARDYESRIDGPDHDEFYMGRFRDDGCEDDRDAEPESDLASIKRMNAERFAREDAARKQISNNDSGRARALNGKVGVVTRPAVTPISKAA